MKTLTLLRHAKSDWAKSGWDDPGSRDFDRPLNPKGRRAAALIGRHLRESGLGFDHVVASPARRVVETLVEVAAGYGGGLEPVADRRIYLASAATLLDVIHDIPPDAERALLVGHNPGLEDLVLLLVPDDADGRRGDVEEKYPTATLAELAIDGDWAALAPGGARLTRFVRPRDLDATLGPEGD